VQDELDMQTLIKSQQ